MRSLVMTITQARLWYLTRPDKRECQHLEPANEYLDRAKSFYLFFGRING
jgi:hypothetical protein